MEEDGAVPKPADRPKLVNWLKGKPGALGRDGESNSQQAFYYAFFLIAREESRSLESVFLANGAKWPPGDVAINRIISQMVLVCRDAEMEAYRHPSQASGRIVAEAFGAKFK